MDMKSKDNEMLLISKEELQRLYRTIREYEELVKEMQQANRRYIEMLVQPKAS